MNIIPVHKIHRFPDDTPDWSLEKSIHAYLETGIFFFFFLRLTIPDKLSFGVPNYYKKKKKNLK